jgi:short-subunit dehydrogenase
LDARGLAVDFLVNNAGFGVAGRYSTTTWEQQRDFLQVMVVAVSELTHRLVPGMVGRKWGRVVNVASLAGLLPGVAGHTLYAASKSYVISFSESLALETAAHGIHVTASCPGFTWSEFHDVSGTRDQVNKLPAFMWLDPEQVARESLDAVMAGVRICVPGAVNRSVARLARVLPRSVVTALMMTNASKFRKM